MSPPKLPEGSCPTEGAGTQLPEDRRRASDSTIISISPPLPPHPPFPHTVAFRFISWGPLLGSLYAVEPQLDYVDAAITATLQIHLDEGRLRTDRPPTPRIPPPTSSLADSTGAPHPPPLAPGQPAFKPPPPNTVPHYPHSPPNTTFNTSVPPKYLNTPHSFLSATITQLPLCNPPNPPANPPALNRPLLFPQSFHPPHSPHANHVPHPPLIPPPPPQTHPNPRLPTLGPHPPRVRLVPGGHPGLPDRARAPLGRGVASAITDPRAAVVQIAGGWGRGIAGDIGKGMIY